MRGSTNRVQEVKDTMKHFITLLSISFVIISVILFSSVVTHAQYPATFGTTSVSNYGITSPLDVFPWSFGTTSLTSYGTYPFYSGISPMLSPYLGNTFFGGIPSLGSLSPLSSVRVGPGYLDLMKTIQYYQYLMYAYNFYLVARSTPMFYMNDLVADYIGSSLYSYATNYELAPQEAILGFIQQYLLWFDAWLIFYKDNSHPFVVFLYTIYICILRIFPMYAGSMPYKEYYCVFRYPFVN